MFYVILLFIVNAGADVNAQDHDGQTVLHESIYYHRHSTIKSLLKHRVNINREDRDGDTPLHVASQGRDWKTMQWLLRMNADPFKTNKV